MAWKKQKPESNRSVSRPCVCHSPPESKFYIGREALKKLQKLTKPQLAHLQNGKEHSIPVKVVVKLKEKTVKHLVEGEYFVSQKTS